MLLYIYLTFVLIFLLFVGLLAYLSKHKKGLFGELFVFLFLKFYLREKRGYCVLNNIYLPDGDATTQLDHLVVCRYGVFVVETKNYEATFYGDPNGAKWIACYRGGKKYPIQNPLRQNFKHTRTLSELTGIPDTVIFPLVVVTGTTRFNFQRPEGVIYPVDIPAFFKRYRTVRIKQKQVWEIVEVIREWQAAIPADVKRNHVDNLRRRHGLSNYPESK